MNSVPRKTFRMISVMIAICLFQVYVLAGATTPNVVATNANAPSNASSLMLGRLMLAGTESILVNGNSANSGTTILSGSQLRTPADVAATVQLGSAGKLYIEPNTNLTVTFDQTNVAVKVTAGNAFVAANAGVRSSVTTPNGKTSTTAGEPGAPGQAGNQGQSGNKDKELGVAIVLGFIATVAIVYYLNRDDGSAS